MPHPFWAGGPEAYAKGLKEQFENRLQEMTAQLGACGDQATRQEIQRNIRKLKSEYRRHLKASKNNIH